MKRNFAIIFLPLLCGSLCGCGVGHKPPPPESAPKSAPKPSSAAPVISRGTVGKIGAYSVGVRTIDQNSANIAVFNPALSGSLRNDNTIGFTVKSGEEIPIGTDFYRVEQVSDQEIQIANTPLKNAVALPKNGLALPLGGVLQLHGFAVELIGMGSDKGKAAARFEIYSNDVPKAQLKLKNAIAQCSVASGARLKIGSAQHEILTITLQEGKRRGVVSIALQPTR